MSTDMVGERLRGWGRAMVVVQCLSDALYACGGRAGRYRVRLRSSGPASSMASDEG